MHKTICLLIFASFFYLFAQDEKEQVKRKVYRTQTGSIIEAPQPLFERARKKVSTKKTRNDLSVPKVLKRTEKVETTYRNELDSLKMTVKALLTQSELLQKKLRTKIIGKTK